MEDSLNLKDQTYVLKNLRSMLKMSYTGCPGPSPAVQFTLKMCDTAGNL